MYRGKLIQPFKVVYGYVNFDTQLTTQVNDFGEPALVDDGTQDGQFNVSTTERIVPCQLYRERPDTHTAENIGNFSVAGNEMNSQLWIVHRLIDLEYLGLLDSDKRVIIKLGDRVVRLLNKLTEELVYTFPEDFYVTHIDYVGMGLNHVNPMPNLVRITAKNRENFSNKK